MSRAHTKKHRMIAVLNYLWGKRLSKQYLCVEVTPHSSRNNMIVATLYDVRDFKKISPINQINFDIDIATLRMINERIQYRTNCWLLENL